MVALEYFRLPGGREPVRDFIDSQGARDRVRILRGLALLEEFWPRLGMPHVKGSPDIRACGS